MSRALRRAISIATLIMTAGILAACAGSPQSGTGYANRNIYAVDRSGRRVRLTPRTAVLAAFRSWKRKNHGNAIGLASYAIKSGRLSGRGLSLAHFVRGLAYHSTNRYVAAMTDYTTAIKANPANHLAYHSRGMLRSIRNDNIGALNDLNTSIRIRPTYSSHFIRGLVNLRLRRIDAAARDASTMLGMNPERDHGYYLRGLTRHLQGQRRLAAADYRRALQINPRHKGARRALKIVNRTGPGAPRIPGRRPDVRMLPISAPASR